MVTQRGHKTMKSHLFMLMEIICQLKMPFSVNIPFINEGKILKTFRQEGAWVAQSVGLLTTPQVTILWFVSSSPASGCVPTARSLEPASDSVSPSLPLSAHTLSLSLSKINI